MCLGLWACVEKGDSYEIPGMLKFRGCGVPQPRCEGRSQRRRPSWGSFDMQQSNLSIYLSVHLSIYPSTYLSTGREGIIRGSGLTGSRVWGFEGLGIYGLVSCGVECSFKRV